MKLNLKYRCLRDYIPLKQGLRQRDALQLFKCHKTQRLYSTKTRIKTHPRSRQANALTTAQRLYSTKTRIKTSRLQRLNTPEMLRDYIPLKQGLRLPVA